jgi:ABC-type uncharacterized transport system involved in gliding motility auxiliary subunit
MGSVATLFPMTRSVEPGEFVTGWNGSTLVSTTADSFATENLDIEGGELVRHESQERQGPISVGVAATYNVPQAPGESSPTEGEKPEEALSKEPAPEAKDDPLAEDKPQGRIVVLGTSLLARNNFLGRVGNLDLLLNSLNWLSSDEDLISIRPKEPESTPIDLSASQMRRIFLGTVIGLPLIIVVAGVRVWWLRRA